jgi:hypothetical protein
MATWLLLLTYNGKTDLGQHEEIKDCGGKSTGEEAQGSGNSTGEEGQGRTEGEVGDVEENSASSMHA